MNFTSNTSGLDALQARLTRARSAFPGIIHDAAQNAGDAMAKALADKAPHGTHGGTPPEGDATGSLAGSFKTKVEQYGVGAKVEVFTEQPTKLKYIREGTGLYGPKKQLITPLVKKALAGPGLDHPVRSVKGMRANDFVKPVLERENEIVKPETDKAIDELKDILGGH